MNCPYLKYVTKSCNSCSGYFCTSTNIEKKITDIDSLCTDEETWVECVRYIEVLGNVLETAELEKDFTIKIGDVEIPVFPKNDPELLVEVAGARAQKICPYQGPTPPGAANCTGRHCFAENKCIRVLKNCWNWKICTPYTLAKYFGKPVYKAT